MVQRMGESHKTGIKRLKLVYRCRSPPLLSFRPQRNDMKTEEMNLHKKYFVKRNPEARKEDVEWIELSGREFYKFISSPENKERYFIDFEDYIIEATKVEYTQWRKEKDHSDYLRKQEKGWTTVSLYSADITESADGEDVIADETINVQTQVISELELDNLREVLKELDDESYQLMYDLYLSENRKTQRELARELGVRQNSIWHRSNKIRENLKILLVKRKKSSQ